MKFGGMHLHMILVIAVICVVIYVFYVSKDIVSIDKEVKTLQAKVDAMANRMQMTPPPQQMAGGLKTPIGGLQHAQLQSHPPQQQHRPLATMSPQAQAATPSPTPRASFQSMVAPVKAAPVVIEEIDDDTTDEESTVTTDDDDSDGDSDNERLRVLNLIDSLNDTEAAAEAVVAIKTEPVEDLSKLTWNEIKERCRSLNIPIKGSNKEQLLLKLSSVP